MAVQKFTVRLTGKTPLILNSNQCVDPRHPISKQKAAIAGKKGKKKTDADIDELARLEFMGAMYYQDQVGPVVPMANLRRMLVDGARKDKNGKEFESGCFITSDAAVQYDGPREVEKLWEQRDEFSLTSIVTNNGRGKVMRTRPCFRKWALEFDVELVDSLVSLDHLQLAMERAALMCGIGDGRSIGYGRFTFEILSA